MAAHVLNVICVTGANRGIGFEICRQLSRKSVGVDEILMTGRNVDQLKQSIEKLTKMKDFNDKTKLKHFELDVSDKKSIDNFIGQLKNEKYNSNTNGISCFVNNAGIYIDKWDKSTFDKTLMTNAFGPMHLTQELIKNNMFGAPFSQVINLSSGYGAYNQISKKSIYSKIATVDKIEDLTIGNNVVTFDAKDAMSSKYVAAYKISKAVLNRWTQLESQIDHSGSSDSDSKEKEKEKEKDKEKESKESKEDESKENNQVSDKQKVFINCVCPGWVRTDMGGSGASRSVDEGAFGAVRLATQKLTQNFPNGCFFRDSDELSFATGGKRV